MLLRLHNVFKAAGLLSCQMGFKPKTLMLIRCEILSKRKALSLRFVNSKVGFYFTLFIYGQNYNTCHFVFVVIMSLGSDND